MNHADRLQGLPNKDFDQVYNETVAEMQGSTSEEIEVTVNAKMQIRQMEINQEERRNAEREEALRIPITDELYEGWKALSVQEGHTKALTRSDFDQTVQYLLHMHPHKLIYIHAFWLEALSDPAAAHARLEQELAALSKKVESRFKEEIAGEMGKQMTRFIEVMSKRRDEKTEKE